MPAQMALDREVSDAPISNDRIADLKTTRVIFFAGDAIPPHEKYEMPGVKDFGGIYLPHIRTMPQGTNQASRGMLYRCTFTALKTKMKSEWSSMLPPDAREHWDAEFNQTIHVDGQPVARRVKGFTESKLQAAKEGRFETVQSNHLVHKHRYPGQDIKMATTRSMPNGCGGVVEITALRGATNEEIRDAQLFFFPNWNDITQGEANLPETLKELEAHIKLRLKVATGKYKSIGQEMLKSCSEFARTGAQIVTKDESALKAASKDDTQTHSAISEALLPQLQLQRKGEILAGDHAAMNRVANALEKTLVPTVQGQQATDADRELKARELFIKEVELGIRNPDGTLKSAPVNETQEPVAESSPVDVYLKTLKVDDTFAFYNEQNVETVAVLTDKRFGRIKATVDGEEIQIDKGRVIIPE